MTEAGFLETLERVEAVHSILKRMEDIDCVLDKITVIEEFINRFGTLEALIARFEEVERQLYILKEVFNVEEAAKYLNISPSVPPHVHPRDSVLQAERQTHLLREESVGRLETPESDIVKQGD